MSTMLGNSITFIYLFIFYFDSVTFIYGKIILFCTLLINLIAGLIKKIVYVYMNQLIFLTILRIILVMTCGYEKCCNTP